MKHMRIMFLLWQILLTFAFSLHHLHAQSPPGFISLDCGLRDNGYKDPKTGLHYVTDETYVETGEGRKISPEFKTSSLQPQYFNVRSFPGPKGTRSCYTLKPLHGKGQIILLRVSFMYGNYDDQRKVPQFDLYLGVNRWETVEFEDPFSFFTKEIIHKPTSDYLHVCLVNTGHGTPFMSLLELRPMDPSKPVYNTTSGSLELMARVNFGSTSDNVVRYKQDLYDRKWRPVSLPNTTVLNTTATNFRQNWYLVPPVVMLTAAQAPTTRDPINFFITPNDPSDQVYTYIHFAELVANKSREISTYINDEMWDEHLVPPYLSAFTVYGTIPRKSPKYEFAIKATSNSSHPAIVNAVEFFTVKQFPYFETDEDDVAGIRGIKETYSITRNWQGDPCYPKDFAWIGINCSYKGFEPPTITSLNLSSSGLTGTIAPSISNLTMLQSLDLSYNNLSGEVPEFLSWLPSLTYLSLRGNNFRGSLPPALLEKSKSGSLIIISNAENQADQTTPCGNDACKKKKKTAVVPIVASTVGSFLAVFALSSLIYIIIKRKRRAVRRETVESNEKDGSSIEPKLRHFSFSEVMSFIEGREIIGRGGFGTVYRGCMNGDEVAVKVFKVSPEQDNQKDFQSEVKILETVHHRNLTRVLGYCNEGIHQAIIFEFMENGNLNNHLSERSLILLTWERRLGILIGAGQGLEYLHRGCEPPIIHRDIKPQNILLTKDFEAKIADFGLSRSFPFQTSNVAGTPGFLDPEGEDPHMMTEKVDIYSFGVLILVVVTGKKAVQGDTHITQWVHRKVERGDIRGIIDPRLKGNYDINVAWRVVELAMASVSTNPVSRPNMNYVVKELKVCAPTTVAHKY